jgi:hypothetical protein
VAGQQVRDGVGQLAPVTAGIRGLLQQGQQAVGELIVGRAGQQDQVTLPGQHPLTWDRPQPGTGRFLGHTSLPPLNRRRMNGTLIDPLAASHTAGQSYRQKLYAVRGGALTGPAIPGMAPA